MQDDKEDIVSDWKFAAMVLDRNTVVCSKSPPCSRLGAEFFNGGFVVVVGPDLDSRWEAELDFC